jgi:GNAT superfamily N-acetyltransferase
MTFTTRPATPADYSFFVRLFAELGAPDPTPPAERFASEIVPRAAVLEEGGAPVGYSAWNVFERTFHVANVVVAPEARGRGAGRAILEDLRARARAAGCTRWYLNVKQENAVALRLYERARFAIEGESWALHATWGALASLPREEGARARIPEPGEDEGIAERLGLERSRIARLRARAGTSLVVLDRGEGEPVGFGAFDPSFPGIHALRVARPALAPVLFEACRPAARDDYLRLFVERDRALADLLRARGAALDFALYQMGALLAPSPL